MRLPTRGQPLHTRSLTIVLRSAEDGRIRVRADVIDLRKTSFVPMPHGIQPAGIIHHMFFDGVVDARTRELESLEVQQPFVAVEPSEATKGECCRDPAPRLQALVGRRFDADFARELQRSFGGALGCSHLLTLFHLLASTLPRALDMEEALMAKSSVTRAPSERFFRRSVFVDGQEPEDGGLHLAVQLTDFHATPFAAVEERMEHFQRQDEVRVLVTVDLASLSLTEIVACERGRTLETMGAAEWEDRSSWLGDFLGRRVMPGLGNALRAEFGERPEAGRLLDALVQIAPGFVQCTPALADGAITAAQRDGGSGRRPSSSQALLVGGGANSCYMWRDDGALLSFRSTFAKKG